jgi:hypothetical protein
MRAVIETLESEEKHTHTHTHTHTVRNALCIPDRGPKEVEIN